MKGEFIRKDMKGWNLPEDGNREFFPGYSWKQSCACAEHSGTGMLLFGSGVHRHMLIFLGNFCGIVSVCQFAEQRKHYRNVKPRSVTKKDDCTSDTVDGRNPAANHLGCEKSCNTVG